MHHMNVMDQAGTAASPPLSRRRGAPRHAVAALALAVVSLVGCGPGGPPLETVEGVVLLDGKPVDGATVTFAPTSAAGTLATAITGVDGRFRLASFVAGRGSRFGVEAGDYAIAVTKLEAPAAASGGDGGDIVVQEPGQTAPAPRHVVPKAYGDTATSGLKATIADGRNDLTLELDSSFKP